MEKQQKFSISPKKNYISRIIVIVIALFFDFGLRFLPAPAGLSHDAWGVIGIFIGSLLLWMTISIDWPSVLCIFSLAIISNFGFTTAFTSAFGNETFVFLMFTFVCTYAVSKTPLIKRISIWFVSNRFAKKSGWQFVIMFFSSITIVGMFMSPTVLFVIMIPILEQILSIAGIEKNKNDKVGKMLYIGMAFCVSISSGMTPIAHVFPILAMNSAGLSIDYFKYMAFAIPVGIISILVLLLLFKIILRPNVSVLKGLDTTKLKEDLPKIDRREVITVMIFLFMIFLWITPSICMDNVAISLFLLVAFVIAISVWSILLIVNGINDKNLFKSIFGAGLVSVLYFSLVSALILKITNIFDVFSYLNATKCVFLIIFTLTLFIILLYFAFSSLVNKNKYGFLLFSISIVFLLLTTLELYFTKQTNQILQFVKDCKSAMPPMLGAILLCIITVDKKPLLNIQDAFKNGIPWSSLLMCAGTLTLGAALTSEKIGLKAFLATNLSTSLSGIPAFVLLLIFVIWALTQTNLSSNMVTATLVSTVANTVLLSSSASLSLPAVIAIIGMLSSYAFATPPSMPHIAITSSSGFADSKDVFTFGFILMILVAIISIFIGYPLAKIIL